jgi:hypothetical protein
LPKGLLTGGPLVAVVKSSRSHSKNVETTPIDSGAIESHYPWGDANAAFHG